MTCQRDSWGFLCTQIDLSRLQKSRLQLGPPTIIESLHLFHLLRVISGYIVLLTGIFLDLKKLFSVDKPPLL